MPECLAFTFSERRMNPMATFANIAADIVQKKQTGLLSVVAKNGEHHVKIFFAEGEIYYITYGDLKDADCLGACETLELSECFFTSGTKIITNGKCPVPTSTIIEHLKKCMEKGGAPQTATTANAAADVPGFSPLRDKLKVAFIRQIGPVGDILFSRILEQWRPSSPPTKQQLSALVGLMKDAIEDEGSRKEFVNEAGAIIS
jgi:hypothetical protein